MERTVSLVVSSTSFFPGDKSTGMDELLVICQTV